MLQEKGFKGQVISYIDSFFSTCSQGSLLCCFFILLKAEQASSTLISCWISIFSTTHIVPLHLTCSFSAALRNSLSPVIKGAFSCFAKAKAKQSLRLALW